MHIENYIDGGQDFPGSARMTASAPAQTLTEAVQAAAARGNELGRGMTIQTRMCVAAMRHIGVPRSDFRANVHRNDDGSFGNAGAFPETQAASAAIFEHRFELADAGFKVIIWDSNGSAIIGTTDDGKGFVTHFTTDQEFVVEKRP